MNFFLENPYRLAAVAAAVVFVTWLVTRGSTSRVIRWLPLAGAALAIVLLFTERSVVTLREEIGEVLRTIAEDIESNDRDRIVRHVSRTAPELTRDAGRYIPRFTFHRANVKRNLRVEREGDGRVMATFNAVFLVSETRGDVRNLLSPWYFIVHFLREDGTWKVAAYQRLDPREGL